MQIRGGRKERRRGRRKVEEGEKTKGGKVRRPGEKVRKRKRQNGRPRVWKKRGKCTLFCYEYIQGFQWYTKLASV